MPLAGYYSRYRTNLNEALFFFNCCPIFSPGLNFLKLFFIVLVAIKIALLKIQTFPVTLAAAATPPGAQTDLQF